MENEAKRRRFVRIEPGDALLEFASIVIAILLALAVNNWQSGLHEKKLLRDNVANIVHELEYNQRSLQAVMPQHERETDAILNRVDRELKGNAYMSLQDFFNFFRSMAPRGLGPLRLQSAAWRVAQSDASIAIMPTSDRLELESIYDQQEWLQRYDDALVTQVESLRSGNTFPTLMNMFFISGDVVDSEEQLAKRYARVIPRLRRAYGLN